MKYLRRIKRSDKEYAVKMKKIKFCGNTDEMK